ncbi:MAG: AmmeMemoRadiSam system protein A [Propionibacteriaceae bacterium]|jgi:AmmeMemoRadiSam system protein A|nr:AmmeMemoRadiSam system protein A [Propionibacteriaceae bacterium]
MTGLPAEAGAVLTGLARATLARRLGQAAAADPPGPVPDWLRADGASFVTLEIDGQLRGCIGSLEAHRPLAADVAANAVAAAFLDPRFPPLSPGEYGLVDIEVSVLTAPEPLLVRDEADARARLRPGVDGVILAVQGRRATYLPQVWDDLPDPAVFLASLRRKAGLPASYWGPDLRLWRYGVTAFREPRRT